MKIFKLLKVLNVMKTIINKLLPPRGFKAINLFGFVFVRDGVELTERERMHEAIHTAQMKEMLYVPFYLWYVTEWLVRLVQYRNAKTAYRNISFEREAYDFEAYPDYTEERTPFKWITYLKNKS